MTFQSLGRTDIIPNAAIRLVGKASVSKPESNERTNIGSVVETDEGALLLWLQSYPAHTQRIQITLEDDFGTEQNEIGVLIDHVQWTPEFTIGEVAINGRAAEATLFGIPEFAASLLLRPPNCNSFRTVRSTPRPIPQ